PSVDPTVNAPDPTAIAADPADPLKAAAVPTDPADAVDPSSPGEAAKADRRLTRQPLVVNDQHVVEHPRLQQLPCGGVVQGACGRAEGSGWAAPRGGFGPAGPAATPAARAGGPCAPPRAPGRRGPAAPGPGRAGSPGRPVRRRRRRRRLDGRRPPAAP